PYLTTIYLRYCEQLPIADVAARTNVPSETARSRIQRGIELLRVKLDRQFGSRRGWVGALGHRLTAEAAPPAKVASITAAWIALGTCILAVVATRPWNDAPRRAPLEPGERAASGAVADPRPHADAASRTPATAATSE